MINYFNREFEKIFKHGRIINKIKFLLYFLLFLPIFIISIFNYIRIYNDFNYNLNKESSNLVLLATTVVGERLNRLEDVAITLASRPRAIDEINSGNWQKAVKTFMPDGAKIAFVRSLFLTDPGGRLLAGTGETNFEDIKGQNFAYQDWYQGVTKEWKPYISCVYQRTNAPKVNVVALATPIWNLTNDKVIGILVFQLDFEKFGSWLNEIKFSEKSFFYLVDQKGQLVYHSKMALHNKIIDFSKIETVKNILRGKHGTGVFFNQVEKEKRFVSFYPISDYRWGIVLGQELDAAFALRNKALIWGLVIDSIVLIIALLFGIFFLRFVSLSLKMENQLRCAFLYNRSLIEVSIDALVTIGPDGKIMDVNKSTEEVTGYPRQQLVGKKFSDYFTDPEKANLGYQKVFEDGSVHDYYLEIRHRDGHITPVFYNASIYRDEVGKVIGVFAAARDVSEMMRAEEKLKAMAWDLQQKAQALTESNKELEAFSYSISHDLKAPLRAITGFTSILFQEYGAKLDDEAKRIIGIIHVSVSRMAQLIDDLLTLSHTGRKAMQIIDLEMTKLAQEAYAEVELLKPADKVIEITINSLPSALGDELLVKQVFINLFSNAIKFASTKEKIVIEVSGYDQGQKNVYCVKDNGVGFDMKYVDKLFGVFCRLHTQEEFKGTGIGLAIVKNAITHMGGIVWAESKINQGASLYFSLPKGG